jgi:putative membrane protein
MDTVTDADEAIRTEKTTAGESTIQQRRPLFVFLIGLCMGSADAVPGVSGGTVALIAGIYGRLVDAIAAVSVENLAALARAFLPAGSGVSTARMRAVLDRMDALFVATLLAGVGTAVVAVGRLVEHAAASAPVLLYGLFFGLIGASALVLWRALTMGTARRWLAALAGFSVAFALSGGVRVLDAGGPAVVFLAGTVAVSAMVLPGVSGSLLLLILGQYVPMYAALNDFLDGLARAATGGSSPGLVDSGGTVLLFLVGGTLGVLTVGRVIRRLLDTHREATLSFLVALVVGALRAPITELSGTHSVAWTADTLGTFAAVAALGAALVLLLDRYALDLDFEAV